jgi:hypothetical protein
MSLVVEAFGAAILRFRPVFDGRGGVAAEGIEVTFELAMMISLGSLRLAVGRYTTTGRRRLGLPLGQLLPVLHEQIVDGFPQENRLRDSGLIGELVEQSGLRWLEVEGLQLLDAFGFGSHTGIMS